jgi:hypothetical protein
MENESTHGLRLDQLAGLLSLGVEDPGPAEADVYDEKMAGLLREQLSGVLPRNMLLFDALVMMMGRLGCDVRCLAGRSLLEVLRNPQSDLGLLQAIKDCSKKLSFGLDSKTEATLATIIYYAALASALVYHHRKITRYSCEELDRSFATFAAKKWMGPELSELFSRARRVCSEPRGANEAESHPSIE